MYIHSNIANWKGSNWNNKKAISSLKILLIVIQNQLVYSYTWLDLLASGKIMTKVTIAQTW